MNIKMDKMIRHKYIAKLLCARRFIASSGQEINAPLTITDMPHPKTLPIFGTRISLWLHGGGMKLHEYVHSRHMQLGPIFAERLGGNTELVFLSNPDFIKALFINHEGKYPAHILPEPWVLYDKLYESQRGLFFMNGEEWLINRRIANKHLLKEDTEEWVTDPIKNTVNTLINNWKNKSKSGYLVKNLESELYKLSINVLINILIGTNSPLPSCHHDELITKFSVSVKQIFQTTTKLYTWPVNWSQRLNLKIWKDFKESVDLSLFLSKKIAREILKNKMDSNGLIQRLVRENMADEVITRIVADFVIAAGDTTAYSTLWILLLLSQNSTVVEEIRDKDKTFVKFVVKEAMRMYPVAPFLTRILPKDTRLGNYCLNKGTPIIASIYTSGRDDKYFSEPHLFLPYRWDRNDLRRQGLTNHVPFASLPFALGARSCIGKKIAIIQLTEVVSQIVHNFNFKCVCPKNVKAVTSQVLVPDKKVELYLEVNK